MLKGINTTATSQRSLRTSMSFPKARCSAHALGTIQPTRRRQDCALRFGARRNFFMASAFAVARRYAGLARATKRTLLSLATLRARPHCCWLRRHALWPQPSRFGSCCGRSLLRLARYRVHMKTLRNIQETPSGKQIFRHWDSNPGRSGEGRVS